MQSESSDAKLEVNPTKKKDVHVFYSKQDGLYGKYIWHVKSDADSFMGSRMIVRGKRDALEFGRMLARRLKTDLVIHNMAGDIVCVKSFAGKRKWTHHDEQ